MCQRAYSSQTKQPIQLYATYSVTTTAYSLHLRFPGIPNKGATRPERKKSCNPRILLKQSFALSNEDRELAHYNSMITKAYGLFLRRLTELDWKDGLKGGILAKQEDRQRGKRLELLLQRSW
jgi:hypothetical protein